MVCRLVLVLAMIACSKKDPPPPAPQPQPVPITTPPAAPPELPRPVREPGTRPARPAKLDLVVTFAGKPISWPASVLEGANKLAPHPEAPDVWSLREVVKAQLGAKARVTAVISADGTQAIDEAMWKDSTTLPILHTTRRGSLLFRWQDAHGVWGEVVTKDVTGLEVQNDR